MFIDQSFFSSAQRDSLYHCTNELHFFSGIVPVTVWMLFLEEEEKGYFNQSDKNISKLTTLDPTDQILIFPEKSQFGKDSWPPAVSLGKSFRSTLHLM